MTAQAVALTLRQMARMASSDLHAIWFYAAAELVERLEKQSSET